MKAIKLLALGFVISLLSMTSFSAKDIKIGVINLPKVMQDASKVQKIQANLKKKYDPRHASIMKRQTALQTKVKSFERDAAIMKAAKKEATQRQIAKEQRNIQRLLQDFQQDFSAEQGRAMQAFIADLKKTINKYSKDNGYDLILREDAAPYASARVDITGAIVKKLNATS